MKQVGKEYGDLKRKATPNNVTEGDTVFVERMIRSSELDSNYLPEAHTQLRKEMAQKSH